MKIVQGVCTDGFKEIRFQPSHVLCLKTVCVRGPLPPSSPPEVCFPPSCSQLPFSLRKEGSILSILNPVTVLFPKVKRIRGDTE